jgi:hypothetical protein
LVVLEVGGTEELLVQDLPGLLIQVAAEVVLVLLGMLWAAQAAPAS